MKTKLTVFLFGLFLIACSNIEDKIALDKNSYSFVPAEINIKNYEGENIPLKIKSNIEENLNLRLDFYLNVVIDDKEYALQRHSKNKITPSGGFEISLGSRATNTSSMELGFSISQEKHIIEIDNTKMPFIIKIKGNKEKTLKIKVITKDLYYIKNEKEIDLNQGTIHGSIDVYTSKNEIYITTIPIKIEF